jgi:hypothetical protein
MSKLVEVEHGRVTLAVPEGWVDESTVSFSSPTAEGLAAPLSPKQAPAYRSTLNVTVEPLPEGVADARALLEGIGESLRGAGVTCEDVAWREDFSMGGRAGALVERKVILHDTPARQLMAAAIVGDNAVVASAATAETEIERERSVLEELLGQVRFS